jgi:hypothetical protein
VEAARRRLPVVPLRHSPSRSSSAVAQFLGSTRRADPFDLVRCGAREYLLALEVMAAANKADALSISGFAVFEHVTIVRRAGSRGGLVPAVQRSAKVRVVAATYAVPCQVSSG